MELVHKTDQSHRWFPSDGSRTSAAESRNATKCSAKKVYFLKGTLRVLIGRIPGCKSEIDGWGPRYRSSCNQRRCRKLDSIEQRSSCWHSRAERNLNTCTTDCPPGQDENLEVDIDLDPSAKQSILIVKI